MRRSLHPWLGLAVFILLPLAMVQAQRYVENASKRALFKAQSQAASRNASDRSRLESELHQAQDKLKDWPNLARYRDANSQLPRPAPGEARVLFMGDSITDSWGRKYGTFFPGKPYINRGISGQTTPQMLIRFRPDVIALQPAVVVILAGTNDIAGNTGPMPLDAIEGNLASMVELARTNKIRVVLASVLPVSNYGHDRQGNPVDVRIIRSPEKILELNTWIKKYAADHKYVYLD